MFLEEDDVESIRMADPARREEEYVVINDTPMERDTHEIVSEKGLTDPMKNNAALSELIRIYEDARATIAEKDNTIQNLT